VGVYGGPKVSPDGLVLALDGANLKSFKGEATTNEIVVVTWAGDGSNQASFVKESILITDENLKYKGYETYLWSPGTSNNCYLNGADLSTSRTSTVWTFSCYVKRQDGAPITSLSVYMYYPTSDGSAAGTIQDVGNGWYRISRTRTGTDNYLSLIGFTGFVTGHKYYLSGAQLEKKSYPTTFVATNTTRGTTVATGGGWADLTGNGNHGELVNGVGENSANGGSLVFDGVNDGVQLPGTNLSLNQMTISSWNFSSNYVHNGFMFEKTTNGSVNTQYSLFFNNNTTSNLYYRTYGLSTTDLIVSNANSGVVNNQWNNVVATWDGTNKRIYVNGILRATSANLTGTVTQNSTGAAYIGIYGNFAGYPFNGRISQTQIYNRALTAQEIQQNFNATRSRFGV
jgi:hypothetical protein